MSTLRLVRRIHTSAALANATANASTAISTADATAISTPKPRFTDKGRPILQRPPRTVRVNLPSGFPEPPSYPPTTEYFKEVAEIKSRLNEEGLSAPKKHPLWAFFHVPRAATVELAHDTDAPPDMGSVERMDDEEALLESGRSWSAKELRLKSFEDLHTLWYVLVRERNVLATQREERRRLGVSPGYGGEVLTKRAYRCRKSMARIKYVLNERRLALIAAGAASLNREVARVPSSIPGVNDPLAHAEALAGKADAPSLEELTGLSQKRRKARAARVVEQDDFDGEGLEKEMAEVEEEERAEKEKERKE